MNEKPKAEEKKKPKRVLRVANWIKSIWKNEEAKSAIQSFANLATTISAFLTLCALAWTIIESNKRESQEEIRNLQKPMVYSIIRDRGSISFDEISTAYRMKATQAKLPTSATKDTELNRVLLSLMETHVIARDPNGRYLPTVTSTMRDEAVANMLRSCLKTIFDNQALLISNDLCHQVNLGKQQ